MRRICEVCSLTKMTWSDALLVQGRNLRCWVFIFRFTPTVAESRYGTKLPALPLLATSAEEQRHVSRCGLARGFPLQLWGKASFLLAASLESQDVVCCNSKKCSSFPRSCLALEIGGRKDMQHNSLVWIFGTPGPPCPLVIKAHLRHIWLD